MNDSPAYAQITYTTRLNGGDLEMELCIVPSAANSLWITYKPILATYTGHSLAQHAPYRWPSGAECEHANYMCLGWSTRWWWVQFPEVFRVPISKQSELRTFAESTYMCGQTRLIMVITVYMYVHVACTRAWVIAVEQRISDRYRTRDVCGSKLGPGRMGQVYVGKFRPIPL